MPTTVADLIARPELGLRALVDGEPAAITWASSSDLADPTPFLMPGQLLLTTGLQFPEDAPASAYDDYVAALIAAEVVGIGFGTEVLRAGTPEHLVAACRRAGLALVEVPYRTPFLAISRRVAREAERDARRRDDWTLAALRALSNAALQQGDVMAVLRELAARLAARVLLFDADGEQQAAFPASRGAATPDAVRAEVRRLLDGGQRAAAEHAEGGATYGLQTLGPGGHLSGVLVTAGPRADRAARSVLSAAVALIEVSEAANRRVAQASLAGDAVVLRLLREGRPDLAKRVAAAADRPLPGGAVDVLVCAPGLRAIVALAEREVRRPGRLVAAEDGLLVCVGRERPVADTAARLAAAGYAVGIATVDGTEELAAGVARATVARDAAAPGTSERWASLPTPDDFTERVRRLAAGLGRATREEVERITAAEAWLAANCSWGGAARHTGLHPHTVRDRTAALAAELGISLATFEGRAELWAVLRSARD